MARCSVREEKAPPGDPADRSPETRGRAVRQTAALSGRREASTGPQCRGPVAGRASPPRLAPPPALPAGRGSFARRIPQRVRSRFRCPALALVTMPWKYPPGVVRKCAGSSIRAPGPHCRLSSATAGRTLAVELAQRAPRSSRRLIAAPVRGPSRKVTADPTRLAKITGLWRGCWTLPGLRTGLYGGPNPAVSGSHRATAQSGLPQVVLMASR
jgi:hypothetical protein